MDVIRRQQLPPVRRPIAIVAFGGWNDACDVASTAANFVIDAHDATSAFAEIEPDPFYDFQQHRPIVEIKDGVSQSLTWPSVSFTAISRLNDDRDLIVVTGPEPNFRWKTFARSLVEVLDDIGVEEVILVGAYVGVVGHRESVSLSGVATDTVSVIRSGLESSSYNGPTGMVGVVQGACKEVGIRSLSLWAATPPYLSGNPFPKAVLAIVEKISDITNLHIDTSELIAIDAEYTQKVDDALEEAGSDVNEYLEEIESYDEPLLGSLMSSWSPVDGPGASLDPDNADDLVDEIVKFLEGNS
ncbi:MAG: PAC2 family protein [Acidimicrobiia bacterium]|nr:PAC2 family protein [Acidimicrobiia bacterium]